MAGRRPSTPAKTRPCLSSNRPRSEPTASDAGWPLINSVGSRRGLPTEFEAKLSYPAIVHDGPEPDASPGSAEPQELPPAQATYLLHVRQDPERMPASSGF